MNDLSRRDVALLAVYAALLVVGIAWIVRAIGGGVEASGVEAASVETAHVEEASFDAPIVDAVSVEEASARVDALASEASAAPTNENGAADVAAARSVVVRVVARDGAPAPARERVCVLAVRECPEAALEATRTHASAVLAELALDDMVSGSPALAFVLSTLEREPLHVAAYVDGRLGGVELVGADEHELVLALEEPAAPIPTERDERVELSAAPRVVPLGAARDSGAGGDSGASAAELARADVVRGELRRAGDGPRVFPVLLEPLASVEASGRDAEGDASASSASSTPLAPAALLERARDARLEYSREDGTFRFAPVEPGRYRLRVPSPDEGIPWPSDDELASRPLTIEVGGEGAREHVLVLEPARRVRVETTIDRGALLWWELRDEGGAVLRVAQVVDGRVPDLLLPGGRYEIAMVGVEGERAQRGFVVESVGVGGDAGAGEGEGVVVVELGDVR